MHLLAALPLLLLRRSSRNHAIQAHHRYNVAVMVHVIYDIGEDRIPPHLLRSATAGDHLGRLLLVHRRPDFRAILVTFASSLYDLLFCFYGIELTNNFW